MKKSDLKNGCIVELRNGSKGIKIDNILLIIRENSEDMFGWLKLNDYNNDLIFSTIALDKYDIVKVDNDVTFNCSNIDYCAKAIKTHLSLVSTKVNKWSWKRQENILTDKEREYLKAVIAPVKEYVVNITKCNPDYTNRSEYIRIELNNYIGNHMALDTFEYYAKFKGMELDKKYTLKELGLE